MPITSVLAVVTVTDVQAVLPWYERLFGRPADNVPMPSCAEWHLADHGWVQVLSDAGQPGESMLTLEVDDMDATIAELASRDLTLTPLHTDGTLRLAQISDPDRNVVTFAQALIGH